VKLSGIGKVLTYSVIHNSPRMLKLETPYIVAIIELEEGPRVTAQIVDCDPADVKIGTNVKVTFRKLREDGKSGVIHYGYKFVVADNSKEEV
jgi:hypothetical protein